MAGVSKKAEKTSMPKAKKISKKVPATGAEEKATTSKCTAKASTYIHSTQSPLEETYDLDNLPLDACVELTRRLLTALPAPSHQNSPNTSSPENRNPLHSRNGSTAYTDEGEMPATGMLER